MIKCQKFGLLKNAIANFIILTRTKCENEINNPENNTEHSKQLKDEVDKLNCLTEMLNYKSLKECLYLSDFIKNMVLLFD